MNGQLETLLWFGFGWIIGLIVYIVVICLLEKK